MAYSSFERSINARKQLRDRYGKWIYQGGSVKWFDAGSGSWKSGLVDSFDGDYVNININGSGDAKVHRSAIESIPKKATLGGGDSYSKADFEAAPPGSKATIPGKENIGGGKAADIVVTKNDDDSWSYTFSSGEQSPDTYTPEELADQKAVITEQTNPQTTGPQDISDWTEGDAMGGSNGARKYTAPDGSEYVVKFPQTADHANNEVLASRLYDLAKVKSPSQELVIKDGQLGVASPLVPGASSGFQDRLNDKDFIEKIQEGFAADAWLANWDVAGLTYDNIISDENDDPIRIDPGGSLRYRAQGAPKGDKFGDSANEWESLTTAPEAGKIFGPMTDEQKKNSAQSLVNITDEQIDEIVDSVDFTPEIADELKNKLKNRRDDILNRAGLEKGKVPENEQGDVVPQTPSENNLKFNDGSDSGIPEDSEFGQFLDDKYPLDKYNILPSQGLNDWFKTKFGGALDKNENPGWLDKSTGEYDLEPGDIVFGYMQNGPLQGSGKQKFVVGGTQNGEGQHVLHHLPKWNQKEHSPGIIFHNGKKNNPNYDFKITSAVRPPQTSTPKPKEEKRVTVSTADLPGYSPKKGDWVSETDGPGYLGSAQKWHIVLEDSPSKTNIAGDPVYMVHNANGPQAYAPDTYGIKPQNIKSIQVTQERLDEIKNTEPTETGETKEKSWFSPADDPGEDGDGYHTSGPWGKFGAAGVMIQDQESGKFLLVQRGPMVSSNKGKWQLPGGALNSNESPAQGSARETIEELKVSQDYLDTLEHKGDVVFDNGQGWQYTNITATAPSQFTPEVDGTETGDAKWVSSDELKQMQENGELHPAFSGTLNDLLDKFDNGSSGQDQIVDVPENQVEDLAEPALDENQDTLDQIKENLGVPKTSVKDPKELEDLPEGSRINMYNTMFKENNHFVKTKEGKWWPEAFGPVPAEPKPLELQDNEDMLVDGFITEIVSNGPETPQQSENQEERRVSTGPTDLDNLPSGSTIQFSDSDSDKTYTKNEDGTFTASWLGDDHPQKNVTSDQVHAVASYLGKDVEVVSEQPNVPEVKEMREVVVDDGEFSKDQMDTIDSLEETAPGSIADTHSAEKTKFEKLPSGFWQDVDSGVGGYTPDEIVEQYGADIDIDPPTNEEGETSAPREADIKDLYDDAGVDTSTGDLNGLEEYLQVGDKLTLKGLLDTYPVTKQEDWSWTSDDTGAVIIYPGELDTQDPKNIVNITTRGTVYNNNDNSNNTSGTSPQQDTSHSGEVVNVVNGINIDGDGNQWVPDKNGQPLYNGTIVKNKKGELGKVTFLQKGGKKVRVDTPDGDTKFWNSHMVERTDEAFVPEKSKYEIQVNGDGKEYVTNNNGDMIFVGDTVTSPGKAGFTGTVQGFKSNGQFVLVLDPADNKVKPRKTDKITVDESAASTAETPAVPEQSPETPQAPEFNDGDSVQPGDFSNAPVGSKFHAGGSKATYEKTGDNTWKYYPPTSTVPSSLNYSDSDMEDTLKYGTGPFIWGPPEPAQEEPQLAQWEKELLGTYNDGNNVDPKDIPGTPPGFTLHTPTPSGGYFKKMNENEWGYFDPNTPQDTPVYLFPEKSIIDAVDNKKDGATPYKWGMPPTPATEESSNNFSEGDSITNWQDLVDFKVGEYINLITGTQKFPYIKQDSGDFYNPIAGYSFSPAEFENAINEGDIEYGGEEYIDNTELEPGQKINSAEQFNKLVPGDTISVEGSAFDDPITFEKLENGDFKNDTGQVFSPSMFNGAVNTSAVTYTGKTKTTSNHTFKNGDKIENLDDLDLLTPGEKVTHNGNETYTKNSDGTFQDDDTSYGGAIPKISFEKSVQNGTLEYGDTTSSVETPSLKPGDKVTEISQLENMETGDMVTVSISDGAAVKNYTKGSDGLFNSGSKWHKGHTPDAFKNTISEGEVTYKGKEETSTPNAPSPGDTINTYQEMDNLPEGSTFEVKFEWTPKTKTYVKIPNNMYETTSEDGYKSSYGSYAFDGAISDGNVVYTGRQNPGVPAPEPTPAPIEEAPSLPGKNGKKVSVGAQVTKASTATKPAYSGEIVDINTATGDVTIKLSDGSKKKAKAKFLDVDQEVQVPTPETPATNEYQPAMYDVTPVVLPKNPDSPWYEKPMPQPPEAPPAIPQPKWDVDGLREEINEKYEQSKGKPFDQSSYKNLFEQLSKNGKLSIPGNFTKNEEKYGEQNDLLDFFQKRGYISEETANKAREYYEEQKKAYDEKIKEQEKDQSRYNKALTKYTDDLVEWKVANGVPLDSFNKYSYTLSNPDAINDLLKNQGDPVEAANKNFPSEDEAGWTSKDKKAMKTWVSGGSYDDHENPENSWSNVAWESWSQAMYKAKESALLDPNNLDNKNYANAYKAIQEAIGKSEAKDDIVITRAGEIRNFTNLDGVGMKTLADLKNAEGSVLATYSVFAGSPGSHGVAIAGLKDLDIQVRVPKGAHGAWLAGKNDVGMQGEKEVLLPPGSKYYIHQVISGENTDNGRHRVIVDLVPNDWTPEFEKQKGSSIVVGPGGVVQTQQNVPGVVDPSVPGVPAGPEVIDSTAPAVAGAPAI